MPKRRGCLASKSFGVTESVMILPSLYSFISSSLGTAHYYKLQITNYKLQITNYKLQIHQRQSF